MGVGEHAPKRFAADQGVHFIHAFAEEEYFGQHVGYIDAGDTEWHDCCVCFILGNEMMGGRIIVQNIANS